jgi:signal transduction histidine kinase
MCVSFTDTGCGIAPENLAHLFDPFFTTKEVGEGTGLGLSISHNIIDGHSGRIEVDSSPGVGTTFRIFLPLTQE